MTQFSFLIILWFALRGIVEGMVMVKPDDMMFLHGMEAGVRGHVWFLAYHGIAVARDVSLILSTISGYKLWRIRKWFS